MWSALVPKLGDIPRGWHDIVRRCSDELAIDAEHFDLDEDNGRLRINVTDVKLSRDVARAFVLAQFRSLYTCSVCGRPGRHRRPANGPRVTLCDEHTPPHMIESAVVYTERKTPWRRMSDGAFRYDVVSDILVRDDRADVVERWQREEISGHEAREQIGAKSYGGLYKLAKRYEIKVRVLPRDLLGRCEAETITDADAAEFLGSSIEDWLALKVALTTS